MAEESKAGVSRIRRQPQSFAELPDNVLKIIYKHLPESDLLSVTKVCREWNDATKDSSVWKHCPMILVPFRWLNNTIDVIVKIASAPYVHTIRTVPLITKTLGSLPFTRNPDGWSGPFVEAILQCAEDLRRLNVEFFPPLSVAQVSQLVQKFPELESFTLNMFAPDVVESLEALKCLHNLKEITFYYTKKPPNSLEMVAQVCKSVANGFPTLTTLGLHYFHLPGHNDAAVSSLLKEKIDQLTSLRLPYDTNYNRTCERTIRGDILSMIFNCSTLSELTLRLTDQKINLERMVNLKSLTLYCDFYTDSVLSETVFPKNLDKLRVRLKHDRTYESDEDEYYDSDDSGARQERVRKDPLDGYRCGILHKIISTCQNLKHLHLDNVPDYDINEQMQDIGSLVNLQILYLTGMDISSEGAASISKCKNLMYLWLTNVDFSSYSVENLSSCSYLKRVILKKCNLHALQLLNCITKLKYLTHFCVHKCSLMVPEQPYYCDYFEFIVKACRKENHHVKFTRKFDKSLLVL